MAGNPENIHAAMAPAKMGEANEYHASTTSATPAAGPVAAAARTTDASKIHSLELSVQDLAHKLDKLITNSSGAGFHQTSRVRNPRTNGQASDTASRVCYNCQSPEHVQRRCNWQWGPQIQIQWVSYLKVCKLMKDKCQPSSGNGRYPRGPEGGPSGTKESR